MQHDDRGYGPTRSSRRPARADKPASGRARYPVSFGASSDTFGNSTRAPAPTTPTPATTRARPEDTTAHQVFGNSARLVCGMDQPRPAGAPAGYRAGPAGSQAISLPRAMDWRAACE